MLSTGESRAYLSSGEVTEYLADCRTMVLDEIRSIIPDGERGSRILYDLMLEYPLREAKAIRPALCIAMCRALGGFTQAALPTAAVLELYHNAFLIHDDVEDDSERRRGQSTLHRKYGVPIAVNVGDALLALTLQPLLGNMQHVGMGRALRVLAGVAEMARVSAIGQAVELDWIRCGVWDVSEDDYVQMVREKTACYTFETPVRLGAILAGVDDDALLTELAGFASDIGVAFQIQDDLLNVDGEDIAYGKEAAGDLWEGKRTLILLAALERCERAERERAIEILNKPRPASYLRAGPAVGRGGDELSQHRELVGLLADLRAADELSERAHDLVLDIVQSRADDSAVKTADDVRFLLKLIQKSDAADYARSVAARYAHNGLSRFEEMRRHLVDGVHTQFIAGVAQFVVQRSW